MRELHKLRALLSLHEGRVPHVYKDSLGYYTIGVGHLVDEKKGGKLPEQIIDALLDFDIGQHVMELLDHCPWVASLDDVRQAVLFDMAFNLGVPGLLGFKNTLRMVREGDFKGAAKNMLLSRWATQVGSRAVRLSRMMDTGEWPSDV